MYIKLTRLDNSPIWINAAFVVTVEPRKGGGSVVVPIGDGLDYDVRETTDQVLAMLGEAPVPTVVPVPAPKMLAPTPEDVSPDTEPLSDELPAEKPTEETKPAKRTRRAKKATAEKAEGEAETKPAKRTRRTKKATAPLENGKASDDAGKAAGAEGNPLALTADALPLSRDEIALPADKPVVELTDEQIARLKKMMPRSMRKLWNTLVTQFKVALKDAEGVIDLLQARGVIEVGPQDHIVWKCGEK